MSQLRSLIDRHALVLGGSGEAEYPLAQLLKTVVNITLLFLYHHTPRLNLLRCVYPIRNTSVIYVIFIPRVNQSLVLKTKCA